MSIYIITHKKFNPPKIKIYRTLLVGAYRGHILGEEVLNDDVGDNISNKNANYCELTGLYWIWKNISEDFIGLVHYRRYFCKRRIFKSSPLSKNEILKILSKYDIILPSKVKIRPNVYTHYEREHYKEDLDICLEIIDKEYHDFSFAAQEVMKSDRASLFNMFIMPKPLMDEYCAWLFDILFKAEKRIDVSDRNDYQKRVFGFLSERLFNVWLYKKNLKTYYAPVYNIGESPLKNKIKTFITKVKNRLTKQKID